MDALLSSPSTVADAAAAVDPPAVAAPFGPLDFVAAGDVLASVHGPAAHADHTPGPGDDDEEDDDSGPGRGTGDGNIDPDDEDAVDDDDDEDDDEDPLWAST